MPKTEYIPVQVLTAEETIRNMEEAAESDLMQGHWRCKKCNERMENKYKYCGNCGKKNKNKEK